MTGCPKHMVFGPCGGVMASGGCEIDAAYSCPFVPAPVFLSGTETGPSVGKPATAVPRGAGRFERALRDHKWVTVAEINAPDSIETSTLVAVSERLAGIADVISITDHSGANVHMSSLGPVAQLLRRNIEAMPTFTCRDRNRIALQGDLLAAASFGASSALIVTGNHVLVGDSPGARPVFDLDSTRLLQIARQLRDEGRYENGRMLGAPPALLLGAAAHPFAPPLDRRADQVLSKVAAGADFVITQHIFDLHRWRHFIREVNERRRTATFHLLGGVAILPDEPTARRVNANLRGFTIPDAIFARLAQARDPQLEGIAIAAETLAELQQTDGVSGCLLAAVTNRSNALAATGEQVDVLAAVLAEAGLPGGAV